MPLEHAKENVMNGMLMPFIGLGRRAAHHVIKRERV